MEEYCEMLGSQSMNKPIRIAVDARCLNRPHLRGIGKVLTKIIEYSASHFHWLLMCDRPDLRFHMPKHPRIDHICAAQRGFRFNAWEQFRLPSLLKKSKPDILLCPANSAPLIQTVPTIVILHDTIPWAADVPSEPQRGKTRSLFDHWAFKKCEAITTISKSSADDILKRWPNVNDKLEIIPNGIDRPYLEESHTSLSADLKQRGIRQPFFIYCGGSIPRKRADWAMEAFEAADLRNTQLVLCGVQESELPPLRHNKPASTQIITPGFIPEKEMPCLFQNSLGVLYPTLYEGFGLPAIEAQASGVACLMSPVSSLRELVGPGTINLPTHNKKAWTDAIASLYRQNGLPPADARASRNWSERYSWKEPAKQYSRLFHRIAGKSLPMAEASGIPVAKSD